MRYGFVIDQHRCIGCHACTVACKEENQVPLGVFRTSVKYVERGTFPSTRRTFSVLRCNHCDAAPCIAICPTAALFRRDNGIVDLDREACIGCKSCMQACPYDALYLDPADQTAAKCHFCAHRVEVGLAPACVIVCPEQAILAGDLDDPASFVARTVAREAVQVRKPEQGTRPKLFYLGADAPGLAPSMTRAAERPMWNDPGAEETAFAEFLGRTDGTQPLARTVYDAPHARQLWGRRVGAYLWTKSVAAGTLLLAAVAARLGWARDWGGMQAVASGTALLFMAVTNLLLILDLKRPDRFYYIITRGNWSSWLVRGTWVLMGFSGIAAYWFVAALAGWDATLASLSTGAIFLSIAAAGYSAFLFGQAEGRDFWQSPLLFVHLLAAATLAGGATLRLIDPARAPIWDAALSLSLAANALVLAAELFLRHPSQDAAEAARLITRGPMRSAFWFGVVLAGTLIPLLLLGAGDPALDVPAALLALGGLWLYEDLWIRAGQAIPLS